MNSNDCNLSLLAARQAMLFATAITWLTMNGLARLAPAPDKLPAALPIMA